MLVLVAKALGQERTEISLQFPVFPAEAVLVLSFSVHQGAAASKQPALRVWAGPFPVLSDFLPPVSVLGRLTFLSKGEKKLSETV